MADSIVKIIVTLVDQVSNKTGGINDSLKKLGGAMMKTGGIMSATLTAPVVAGFAKMISSASDLNETINKTSVIFGDASRGLIDQSDKMATAAGLSQQAFLDAVGTFGVFGKSAGLAGNDLAGFSTDLTGLAADLASFYNTSPEEAITAIGAALRGESEPIRRYGVLLDDASLRQKALEMGIIDSIKNALTPQQRVLAAQALIMEQTTLAQGDFAKTSDGLANSQRILTAQLGNLATQMGQYLLPIAQQLVGVISQAVGWFGTLSPGMQRVILVVLGLVAAIGPLLLIVGSMISAIGAIIPVVTAVVGVLSGPVLIAIAAVVGAVALLYLAWKNNFLGIQDTVKVVFDSIKLVFAAFKAAFAGDWSKFGELIKQAWSNVWDLVTERVTNAWTTIKTAVSTLIDNVINFFATTDWGQIGKNIVEGIAKGITGAVDWIVKAVEGLGAAAVAAIKKFLGISSPSQVFMEIGQNMMSGLTQGIVGHSGGPVVATAMVAGGMTQAAIGATTNNYNLTINEAGSRGNVVQDFGILKSLAGV